MLEGDVFYNPRGRDAPELLADPGVFIEVGGEDLL
jgi:hypothetical protein